MNNAKPWYLSKTVWGALVSVAASLGAMIGVPLDGLNEGAVTDAILQMVAALAGVVAIFGRMSATERIE